MNRGAFAMPNRAPRSRLPLLRGDLPFLEPGGRLTITSGAPILTAASTTGQSTIIYAPNDHGRVPYREGDRWLYEDLEDEISQALADTEFSPAAGGNSSLYDMWLWRHPRIMHNHRRHKWLCTRGPVWTDATNRSAGTALARFRGARVNSVDIVNGPKAGHGLYVGTIATDGSGTLNMMLRPNAAAGGSANRLDVWNMFNRVEFAAVSRDSTDSLSYVTNTIRAALNSNSNRITLVKGLNEDVCNVSYSAMAISNSGAAQVVNGVGLDSTSAIADGSASGAADLTTSARQGLLATFSGLAGLGQHFFQALECSVNSSTWYGDNGDATRFQMALRLMTRM